MIQKGRSFSLGICALFGVPFVCKVTAGKNLLIRMWKNIVYGKPGNGHRWNWSESLHFVQSIKNDCQTGIKCSLYGAMTGSPMMKAGLKTSGLLVENIFNLQT